MKIRPVPKKRNITLLRYDIASTLSQTPRQKNLRRLPHIFARVLELPFHSNADVLVEETPDCFRFVANTDDDAALREGSIRAHTVEIYPGITKIVIRGDRFLELSAGELELDVWRFRLPASTRPELATAGYDDGELIVTVPKDVNFIGKDDDDDGDDDGDGDEVWGEGNSAGGQIVLVQ